MTKEEMHLPCNDEDCGVTIPHVLGKHIPFEEWQAAHAVRPTVQELALIDCGEESQ